MNASLLAGIYLNHGKPVYGSTDELLDNQFAKAAGYEAVVAAERRKICGPWRKPWDQDATQQSSRRAAQDL